MIKNYLKIAFRNLTRHKGYSAINILGLSIGMACVLLIFLFINDEMSYDSFHQDASQIFRIEWYSENPQTRTPHPMAQEMVSTFPEVFNAVSISPLWGPGLTKQTFSIRNVEKNLQFDEKNVLSVDTTFFDVFDFKMVAGDGKASLKELGNILISESMASKYFADEDPIGKALAINNDTTFLVVAGIFKDIPVQSHIHFDFLISYILLKAMEDPDSEYYTWKDFGHYNYVKLHKNTNVKQFEEKLLKWASQKIDVPKSELEKVLASGAHFRLTPITDIHLKSNILWELESNGNIYYIYILTGTAFLILIIACTNFINLTTARSSERAKEIGIRKTLGAFQKQLSLQFISESIIICFISIILAGLMVEVFLPLFNQLTNKNFEGGVLWDIQYLSGIILLAFLIGLLSGIYPALFLSSIKPVKVLKGKFSSSKQGILFRKAMVTFQFSIAMVLITATIVIYNQLDFLQNRPLGFDKKGIIEVPIFSEHVRNNFETIKREIISTKGVEYISAVSNTPGRQFNQNPLFRQNDPETTIDVFQCYADYDALKVYDLKISQGRFFDPSQDHPKQNNFVINETIAQQLQLENPIGEELIIDQDGEFIKGTVIGMVEDFHFQSLHQPIKPMIIQMKPHYSYAVIKISTENISQTLAEIEEKWLSYNNNYEFKYSFLDENLRNQYAQENKMGDVFIIFAVIAVIIASMGLYGLATLNFHQRKREVGVRKVLGANLSSLLIILNMDFSKLILLAILISSPIAYYLIHLWLNNFNYKINLSPTYFIGGAILIFGLAVITLSYLTIKTAMINPVSSLKDD